MSSTNSSAAAASPSASAAPGSAPRARNLQSRISPIRGHDDLLLQTHGAPVTPVGRACVWERAVLEGMPDWFDTARSAGWCLGLGLVLMTRAKVVARLRVAEQHRQPAGLLHGGISALIAEELGSIASALNAAPKPIVGVNVAATHVGAAKIGDVVIAVCTPVKRGGLMQVWKIDLYLDEEQQDESVAFTRDPTYHVHLQPKGALLATCQLTAITRPMKEAPGQPSTSVSIKSKL